MSRDSAQVSDGVTELRQAFDQAFAAPINEQIQETEDILAIRIAGHSYGLKVREISGVTKVDRIVPLPGSAPELSGIVQVRGALVYVYSLAALLGYGRSAPQSSCWLALCGKHDPIGLDLGEIESYVRVFKSELLAPDEPAAVKRYISQVTRTGRTLRAIIDVASVAKSIRQTQRAMPALE